MQRIIISLIIGSLILGFAYARPAQDSSTASDKVIFATSQSNANFTITCQPKSVSVGKNSDWLDECNRLGEDTLANAARDGLIAGHVGKAFGMSSEFAKSIPPDAPISSKVISRDFPLIGHTL